MLADATGNMLLGVLAIAMVGTVVGFYFVAKGPRWLLLVVGLVLFGTGNSITEINSRELSLFVGYLRLSGVIGIILGLIDFFRRRKPVTPEEPLAKPESEGHN